MSWTTLLNENRMAIEPSSKSELDNLRSIVDRCFSDIRVTGLSNEQRFIVAYDAARTLALMIVRAEGYRPKKFGGHYNTFAGLEAADSGAFKTAADYLQICRLKRNDSEYAMAGTITSAETDELIKFVTQFAVDVEGWVSSSHPALRK
jgi:hypothetical protein